MRPLVTILLFVSIGAVGQQGDRSDVSLSIHKISPTTFGYEVSVKIDNMGAKAKLVGIEL